MPSKPHDINGLLRLHEIVTWQINIAKDPQIRQLREQQQKELQEKIKQIQSQKL